MKRELNKARIGKTAAAALLLAFGMMVSVQMNLPKAQSATAAVSVPIRGFSNMCPYEGQVYCGVNGVYGEPIPQQSSIFTIWEDKIYYIEKVQEAYESMTDELLSLKRADRDGKNTEVLAEDVFLAGAGHEQLIGDKLFYGYEYDENYRMRYACVDVNTKERTVLATDRIDSILGYDGTYLYYNGMDIEEQEAVLGRISLEKGTDETIYRYAPTDEEGYIDSVKYADGLLYCLTLAKKPEGYDYRTYEYRMVIRSAVNGKVMQELPMVFTGAANYSFLVQDGALYITMDGGIASIDLKSGAVHTITEMKPDEYWGILHFIPGDGYLYYEAISEELNENGNNDYFYRVPLEGGEAQLLEEWFMV